MGIKNSANGRDNRRSRRRHQQRGQRAVIEAQFGRDGKRLAAEQLLRRREQNLFLHADVLEQTRRELGVSRRFDSFRIRRGALEQSIEAAVIIGEVGIDFSGHQIVSKEINAKTQSRSMSSPCRASATGRAGCKARVSGIREFWVLAGNSLCVSRYLSACTTKTGLLE